MIRDDSDPAIEGLLEYCTDHQIWLHDAIRPTRVPSRGLGVYATSRIPKGERIIHVPTASFFTTANVPLSFASIEDRKTIPVHALLAAYFAFGIEDDETELQPWMATWPTYSDFAAGTPLTWPEASGRPMPLKSLVKDSSHVGVCVLPPPLTGSYLEPGIEVEADKAGSTAHVPTHIKKLSQHIRALAPILDAETYTALQQSQSLTHRRFLHAWLCVNTRCFSYTPLGTKRPRDPNEAMALCAGMDLFNHSPHPTVKTKYDTTGYFSTTTRVHQAGEEILFSYGHHGNDVLWAEYGFLLDEAPNDAIRIDTIVLAGLSKQKRQLLEESGYLGQYWLAADGVCYRTEVVAWLSILKLDKWQAMLSGSYDPEDDAETMRSAKRNSNGEPVHPRTGRANLKAHRIICASWVAKVETDARNALRMLRTCSEEELEILLGDDADSIRQQLHSEGETEPLESHVQQTSRAQIKHRHAMCIKRWSQLLELAKSAQLSLTESGR